MVGRASHVWLVLVWWITLNLSEISSRLWYVIAMMKTAAPSSECSFHFRTQSMLIVPFLSYAKTFSIVCSKLHAKNVSKNKIICIGDEDTNWFSQPFAVVDPSIRPSSTIEVSDGAITLLFP